MRRPIAQALKPAIDVISIGIARPVIRSRGSAGTCSSVRGRASLWTGFFGAPFEALDVRVDPAGDQADATENVLAHADPVDRELVAIRRDLSTATPLEDSTPTVFVEVVWYEVAPGQIETFAGTLAGLRREASDRSLLPYSVYERVAGAEIGFIIMVWRDRLSTFDEQRRSPRRALERILSELPAGNVSISIVRSVKSEVWLYRPDLTYLGSRGGAR
jgi:hypothetical protein